MEKIYIGKIVNMFGIKGELKIASNFEMPERVFKVGGNLLINDEVHKITGVRFHKGHYLVEIDAIKDINLVLKYKGYNVFIDRDALKLEDEFLLDDLLGLQVYDRDKLIGTVTEVITEKLNPLIKVNNKFYIPINANYLLKVEIKNNKIICQDIEGLML